MLYLVIGMEARRKPSGFIDVNELKPQITLEQVATFYGFALPELHAVGNEVRTRCFLNCGQSHQTGPRTLAIRMDTPEKKWKCHHYGCPNGGDIVELCSMLKYGELRPRGEHFKAILRDMQAMIGGEVQGTVERSVQESDSTPENKVETPQLNVPLAESDKPAARALVNLDEKFLVDPAEMPPAAASYFRHRPHLTPETCREWRMGYLPRDAGGDRRGGTMRGRIVYPMLSEDGDVLTWFGRDPEFERKHQQWLTTGRQGQEPRKVHIIKGFHRGLELFGQHQFIEYANEATLGTAGVLVVEGPNDVIRLATLGQLALGLTSNTPSAVQTKRIADYAEQFGGNRVTLMLDNDTEGENGMKHAIWQLAEQGVSVRLAWSRTMHEGKFRDRQPESLSEEEWEKIELTLM